MRSAAVAASTGSDVMATLVGATPVRHGTFTAVEPGSDAPAALIATTSTASVVPSLGSASVAWRAAPATVVDADTVASSGSCTEIEKLVACAAVDAKLTSRSRPDGVAVTLVGADASVDDDSFAGPPSPDA